MASDTDNPDPFDPAMPDLPHYDYPAVLRAVENIVMSFDRMRQFEGLEAAPEASTERAELYQHIADLIEVGASFDLVEAILSERREQRRQRRTRRKGTT